MQVRFESADTPVTLPREAVRFPVRLLTPPRFRVDRPATWPRVEGRLEFVEGALLFMPPCADYQQDVAVEVARVLGNWSVEHPEFIVGGNEAGMLLDGEVRAADVAVWRRADVGAHRGRFRTVAPVLAIEVAGQDEDESGLLEKAAWYLRHGVRSVWLAFPTTRVVLLVTPRKTHRVAGRRRLSAPGLPGLEPSAEALFRQLGA